MSTQKDIRLPPLSSFERLSSECQHNAEKRTGRQVAIGGPGSCRASTRVGCTSGYLSTWPAHVTSQVVQQGRRHTTGGEIKNHGCSDDFGGPVGKPRFLEQLESYLKKELQALDLQQPKVQERKLQAYREVFGCFIEDFKTYKPLLCAIKNEYEITLAYLRDQIRELEPLRARLVVVSEQCEKRILGLREEERVEIRALKQRCQHRQKVIENMRETQSSLQTQVCCLQADLAAQYLMYREECDARKLLIANISSMSYGPDEEPEEEQEEVEIEDPVKEKLALKVCREDLTKAQVELNRLHAEYGDVVPRRDWETLDHTHKENLLKLETLQKDFDQMKAEYDTLLEVHKQVTTQRDSLQGELEGFKEASTPRPEWEQCADVLGGSERWADLSQGLSSQRRLEILLAELGGKNSEFFTGLGTSDDVPIYLRYEGQLKNHRLKKNAVVRILKEVWKEKVMEDGRRNESSNLPEFLRQHLERQYGEKAGEWAYSLVEGIRQHQKDDSVSLFNDILTGKVDESVYHGQTHLLSNLLKVLIHSDSTESGLLSVQDFRDNLQMAFPLKRAQDIDELVTTAQAELDNNGGSLPYQRLYTEDADGKHKDFLNLVKKQASTERHMYISQLRTQLGGKGEVTVADLRAAFKNIDPSLDATTLDWVLTMAFQIHQGELEQHTTQMDTELALQHLLAIDVTRAGPAPQQD
ncbi:translin-associated factor X-interacting protein 1 [Oncorhynchus keta]|uniref:translin-associated factor X-interacting protein 1 n=1 Tax=Oncorhynchus keta TaxID=8018 RepID=UPI0015FC920F|nr:translin-associated factor X-interacting protein 1 [Oncorhynchus keta]